MDAADLEALNKLVEAIKAACSGGRPVSSVEVTWRDASSPESSFDAIRPFLRIEFSDVPVGEAVPA